MNHVSKRKIQEVENIKELMKKYKVITIADLTGLPSANLQSIRNKLRGKIEIKVTKKSLINISIESFKEKNLASLKPYLENSIPVLIFSDEEPFKLFKLIKDNKAKAKAKPGQVSPMDLTISAGPTPFTPGPIIGELGAIGLQTSVEAGKIVIKKDKLVVKEGEIIKPEIASILGKLNIEPIEINLNVLAVYDNGIVYEKEVLDINIEEYINNIKLAHNQAMLLAEEIGYISKDNVESLLTKAYRNALVLSKELKIEVNTEIKEQEKIIKKENTGFVGYSKDVEQKAQDLLRNLQDKKIQEESKPKQKSMWD
jgi:large subunit ribosomal protein L10